MNCVECKAINSEQNIYCGQCGAELGKDLDATVRKKGFRDRVATEMELTEAVAGRLMKWAGWLGTISAVIVVLFGLLLGKTYLDVRKAVTAGKGEIDIAVKEGTAEVLVARQAIKGLREDTENLTLEIEKYKKVNNDIINLQAKFRNVEGKMLDFGKLALKVGTVSADEIISTYPGPHSVSFSEEKGCPATPDPKMVTYCAKGSPLSLYQLTTKGEQRPVSSFSTMGFQDLSLGPKLACNSATRGTIYIEKGNGGVSDRPFLCVKSSGSTFRWVQLEVTL